MTATYTVFCCHSLFISHNGINLVTCQILKIKCPKYFNSALYSKIFLTPLPGDENIYV